MYIFQPFDMFKGQPIAAAYQSSDRVEFQQLYQAAIRMWRPEQIAEIDAKHRLLNDGLLKPSLSSTHAHLCAMVELEFHVVHELPHEEYSSAVTGQ